jgi:hypothetical protein
MKPETKNTLHPTRFPNLNLPLRFCGACNDPTLQTRKVYLFVRVMTSVSTTIHYILHYRPVNALLLPLRFFFSNSICSENKALFIRRRIIIIFY